MVFVDLANYFNHQNYQKLGKEIDASPNFVTMQCTYKLLETTKTQDEHMIKRRVAGSTKQYTSIMEH